MGISCGVLLVSLDLEVQKSVSKTAVVQEPSTSYGFVVGSVGDVGGETVIAESVLFGDGG